MVTEADDVACAGRTVAAVGFGATARARGRTSGAGFDAGRRGGCGEDGRGRDLDRERAGRRGAIGAHYTVMVPSIQSRVIQVYWRA